MTTPSKDDVLRVAGEPVYYKVVTHDGINWVSKHPSIVPKTVCTGLYTETKLLAMYAAGAADMRERAAVACMSERVDSDAAQTKAAAGPPLDRSVGLEQE